MKISDYWQSCFGQIEESQNKLAEISYNDIEVLYRQATRDIEGKINTWYQRLASDNGVSMAEARKMLSASELKEFKWDVYDYIKYGKENDLSGQWIEQLEKASAKSHISKYDALKIQTQQSIENLFAKQFDVTAEAMKEIYQSGYYRTAFEIQKGFGVGWDISGIGQNQLEKVIAEPWAADGKNFSERIWSNKQKLISDVHKELTRNIIMGADPRKAFNAVANKINVSKSIADRLVMTEGAYFGSAAQRDCFEELGVEEYEIIATLDSHTSEICQSMDGKRFAVKEFRAGDTAPPFHPWCRSTVCPCFGEDFGEKAGDGERYRIPEGMSYEEWKEKFVDGGDKDDINTSEIGDKIRRKLKSVVSGKDIVSFDGLYEKLKREFYDGLNNALPDTAEALRQQIKEADFAYTDDKNSSFNNLNKIVYLRTDAPASTMAHELFHRLDKVNNITDNYGDKIYEALQKDWNALLKNSDNDVTYYLAEKFPDAFDKSIRGKIKLRKEYRGISDILGAMSNNEILLGYGHKTDYWLKKGKKEAEAWAQFGRITYDNNSEVVEMFDSIFTNFSNYAIMLLKGVI